MHSLEVQVVRQDQLSILLHEQVHTWLVAEIEEQSRMWPRKDADDLICSWWSNRFIGGSGAVQAQGRGWAPNYIDQKHGLAQADDDVEDWICKRIAAYDAHSGSYDRNGQIRSGTKDNQKEGGWDDGLKTFSNTILEELDHRSLPKFRLAIRRGTQYHNEKVLEGAYLSIL